MNLDNIQAAQMPNGNLLGYLTWYTIVDCRVLPEQAKNLFVGLGLDAGFIPQLMEPFRAFTESCRLSQYQPKDSKSRLLIRPVKIDNNEAICLAIKETPDSITETLSYQPLLKIELDMSLKPKYQIVFDMATAIHDAEIDIDRLMDIIMEHWDSLQTYLNGNQLREGLKAYLLSFMPVIVRPSGGVYFVPSAHAKTLYKLKEFVEAIRQFKVGHFRGEATMEVIPLVDTDHQKEMVQRSLEEQTELAVKDMLEDLTQLLKADKVMRKTALNRLKKVSELQTMATTYEDILSTKLTKVNDMINIISQQAYALLAKVEAK
jgi:hypothetical protein